MFLRSPIRPPHRYGGDSAFQRGKCNRHQNRQGHRNIGAPGLRHGRYRQISRGDSITCSNAAANFTTRRAAQQHQCRYLAKRVVVGPNSSRTITFAVSWTNVANGYYRNYFTTAQAIASYGRDSAAILQAKVDGWHNKILNSNLPAWLKDLAINCLYVYNCMTDWTTATTNGVAGTYGMAESMSSGNYGTCDQAYHAHWALPIFAPQAEWSQIARFATVQQPSGLFMHLYGGSDGLRVDEGQKFIMEAYKDYQWTGNTAQFKAFYTNIKNTVTGGRSLITRTADGLTDDSDMITYDNPYWDGWNIPSKEFDNELWLAALKAASKAAVVNGTPADTTTYMGYYKTTSASFERATAATFANSGYWDSTHASQSGKHG